MRRAFFAAVLLVASWLGGTDRADSAEPAAIDGCPVVNAGTTFFPLGVFWKDRPDIDESGRCWYSWHLAVMEEPSLSRDGAAGGVSYRFLWLRSFHSPIAVRISHSGDHVQLVAVELLRRAGSYEPEAIARRQSLVLTSQDLNRVEEALNSAQFWTAPSATERLGLDGATWIVEGRKQNNYHVVKRWSPEPQDEFHKLGLIFLELAGWSSSVEPVY